MKLEQRVVAASILSVVVALPSPAGAPPLGAGASTPPCDRSCLASAMDGFLAAMLAGRPGSLPLSPQAEIRENARRVPLDQTAWRRVRAVRSRMTFTDAVTGNVVSRAGVELEDGRPGYISTRLRVVEGGWITDVELSADTSARVVGSYVWSLDPRWIESLPPERRLDRVALEALGRRYFHSLSSHQAVAADFDAGCDRFHSGQQITNVARNSVEGGPARTCASSLEGNPPWGPATEHRFPVVDPERGVLFGLALLHYPDRPGQPRMYVSELFKVVGGRIVTIDNIGLMTEGVETLGFAH